MRISRGRRVSDDTHRQTGGEVGTHRRAFQSVEGRGRRRKTRSRGGRGAADGGKAAAGSGNQGGKLPTWHQLAPNRRRGEGMGAWDDTCLDDQGLHWLTEHGHR
eukprot:283725_1